MRRIGRILGICAGAAVLLAGVSVVASAKTPVSPVGLSSPVEERLWYGVAPEEVDELLSILDPQVEEHPDLFGGVALAYDRQAVELFVADDDYAKLVPEVAALVEENQDIVKISRVEYSLSSLRALQLEVNELLRGSQMASSQIDVMNNSVKVGVESETAARGLTATLNYEKRKIPLQIETISSVTDLAGRYDDYPRYYMGGKIVDANKGWCSLAIPVVVGGTRGVLTAGHCTSGTWGPVYSQASSNAQDGDLTHGIVKGYSDDWAGRRHYTYTQFDGVTEWNSNVRFGY